MHRIKTLQLGHIKVEIKDAKHKALVPRISQSSSEEETFLNLYKLKRLDSTVALEVFQWMLKKDILKQDMLLLGRPDATDFRRALAFRFCELTNREAEYVALSRDTVEGDLKQRREIVSYGTSEFQDQGVVRAAIEGRILILDGLEKTEKNLLPILNNLLENRM